MPDIYEIDNSAFDSGGFGEVYIATHKETGEKFAYKVIHQKEMKKTNGKTKNEMRLFQLSKIQSMRFFFREAFNQIYAEHPCILPLAGWNIVDSHFKPSFVLITPYMENGTLETLLKTREKQRKQIDPTQKMIIFYGICRGMKHLHDLNIIHRDLKPANVFLDKNGYPLIADLGLAKISSKEVQDHSCSCGTPYYTPPEALKSIHYSFSIDVYSMSIIYYLLIEGISVPKFQVLFDNNLDKQSLLKLLLKGERPILTRANENQKNLLSKMWATNPDKRPTFSEIINDIDKNGNKSGYWFPGTNIEEFNKYKQYVISQEKPKSALADNFLDNFDGGDISFSFLQSIHEAINNNSKKAKDYLAFCTLCGKFGPPSASLSLPLFSDSMEISRFLKKCLKQLNIVDANMGIDEIIKKAKQGDIEAVAVYGSLLMRGGYADEGKRLLQMSADAGNPIAMQTLALILYTEENYEESFQYFSKAASKGHPDSFCCAGYAAKSAGMFKEAIKYFSLAFELYGDTESHEEAMIIGQQYM